MDEKKKNQQLEIELKEGVAEGIYSNMTVLAHSPSEFVIDFISVLPGVSKGQVRSRVIMAPEHVKRLMYALQDNISRYEALFGEIKMTGVEMPSNLRKVKPRGDA